MKLALQLGYWTAQPPTGVPERILEAERLGYDIVFTAESWGNDAFTPLAWYASQTSKIRLGTSIVQISARPPTTTAAAAITMDHLSNGRFVLGLGVSGPQVVEGWYGQPFGKPLARTREYIDIVRQVFARQGPVTSDGPFYPLPYHGDGALGLGKALKPIVHARNAELPIWMGAEGPKNVALTAEVADGWLPIYFSPRVAETYKAWLAEGFARRTRPMPETFEIATNAQVVVTDDPNDTIQSMKGMLGFYIGGMGAKDMNFHKEVFARMGYATEVQEVQDLFFAGERDKAIAAVPDRLVTDISIIGSKAKIRDDLARWEEAGVTMLVVGAQNLDQLRTTAEAVLG